MPIPTFYAEMLEAIRNWVNAHHPDAQYACLVVHAKDGAPDQRVTVIPSEVEKLPS
jgi:hypothetical protein